MKDLSPYTKISLSLFYGDKEKCIAKHIIEIEKYKGCRISNDPRVIARVNKYQSVIEELKSS